LLLREQFVGPVSTFPMIDVHLHLLPAVDDGAASIDISIEMLRLASSLGFTSLVATPHLDGPLLPAYEAKVREAHSTVLAAAESNGIPIAIDLGYEIQLSPDLPGRLASGERCRLADSTTVLVELPFSAWPNYAEQTLFAIQTLGLTPLLAHPERYLAVQDDIEKVLTLVQRGVIQQVTFGSLSGLFGKRAQRVAEHIVKADAATVLASDSHSAGNRFLSVSDGLARAEQLIGPSRARQLAYDNPKALIESRPLPTPAPLVESDGQERSWKRVLSRLRA
jgi:protein-tyrosine phosphatase